MKRIGVFCDVSNLYYCLGKRFRGRKLDYRKYLSYVKDLGDVAHAIAYGAQIGDQAKDFIHFLKDLGFDTKWKTPKEFRNKQKVIRKANCDIAICIDIMNLLERLDYIVLGSADGDFADLISWSKDHGVKTIVLASGISHELKDVAYRSIEIPESMLEDKKDEATKTSEG